MIKKWQTIYQDGPRQVQINTKNGNYRSTSYDMTYGNTTWENGNSWLNNQERTKKLADGLNITPEEFTNKLNIRLINHPSEIKQAIKIFNKPNTIAVSGIMDYIPEDAAFIDNFLSKLKIQMGINSTGFVSSPTLSKNSIDGIVTDVESKFNTMPFYVTPDKFTSYISDKPLPENIKAIYNKAPKYSFIDNASKSEGIANAAKSLMVFGGGGDSLLDALKMIEKGNKVCFINTENLSSIAWDSEKSRPKNAFVYLKDQLKSYELSKSLKHPEYPNAGFTLDYVKNNYSKLNKLVRFIELKSEFMDIGLKEIIKYIR